MPFAVFLAYHSVYWTFEHFAHGIYFMCKTFVECDGYFNFFNICYIITFLTSELQCEYAVYLERDKDDDF